MAPETTPPVPGTAEYKKAWRLANLDRCREHSRKWREANRAKTVTYSRKYRAANPEKDGERYLAGKRILEEFKARPCVDCGQTYPPAAMDCDHVCGEKHIAPSRLVTGSQAVLRAELAKCEPRCANCHRIRHANEREGL